jgi:hypothetical protein
VVCALLRLDITTPRDITTPTDTIPTRVQHWDQLFAFEYQLFAFNSNKIRTCGGLFNANGPRKAPNNQVNRPSFGCRVRSLYVFLAASLYTDFQKSKKNRPPGGFFIHRLPKIQKNRPSGRLLYTQTSKNSKKSALRAASLYTDFQKLKKSPSGRLLYTQTSKN